MKYNIIITVLALSFSLFISSCEKEIELNAEQFNPRIVVNGAFSPNDTFKIQISESRNILYSKQTLPVIESATAKLYDEEDNELGTFVHKSHGNYYLSSPTPEQGKTYKLKVSYKDFNDVESESRIPDRITISKIDTSRSTNKMKIVVSFSDDPDQNNYYSIQIISKESYEDSFGPGGFQSYSYDNTFFCTKELFIEGVTANVDGGICGEELFFKDETFSGKQIKFHAEKDLSSSMDTLIVVVKNISEELFRYKLSYLLYSQTMNSPFSEPVQVYSNIKNGFGLFGSYTEEKDTIIIK